MNDESIACLGDVKKGKPRKFAMICKGTSIVSLIVYKKGNVEKRKKEAKESGKGQFCFGVVDGQGVAIRFVLARVDGFDSEPVKATVLKDFLSEAADMKCKPYFEIVDQVQLVLDEDDPLVARYLELKNRLVSISESLPDRAKDIGALCKQIEGHFDQDASEAAQATLGELEKLWSELVPSGTSVDAIPPAPPIPPVPPAPVVASKQSVDPNVEDAGRQFVARLKAVKPAIDAAIANPSASPEIKLRFSEAAVFARQKDFEQANRLLDQVEALIAREQPKPTTGGVDAAAEFVARLKVLKPQIDVAMTTPGANPDIKLRMSEAAVFARKKEFQSAQQLLDQVESLLRGTASGSGSVQPGATPAGLSLVQLGKARLEWDAVRSRSLKQINHLKLILDASYNGVAAERAAHAAAVSRIDSTIETLNEELGDRLDAVLNAEDAKREALLPLARDVLGRLIKFVQTDELMKLIDGNEYVPSMSVTQPLLVQLQEIAKAIR